MTGNRKKTGAPAAEERAARWLGRLNELRKEIAWQEEQVREMRGLFSPGSVRLGERVISTGGASPTESMVLRIEGEEEKLNAMRARMEELVCETLTAAGLLDDTEQRSLLFMRYVNGLAFEAIAEKMDCSVSRVYKLHRQAVTELSAKAYETPLLCHTEERRNA